MNDITLKRLIIVTGASRGVGREIAIECNKIYEKETLFVLIARNMNKLEDVKSLLREQKSNETNVYTTFKFDFSNQNYQTVDYLKEFTSFLNGYDLSKISELFVFYNHGTLILSSVENSIQHLNEFFETNVLSVWKLLGCIRQLFQIEKTPKQYHINISSKSAYNLHPHLSAFSSSKKCILRNILQ